MKLRQNSQTRLYVSTGAICATALLGGCVPRSAITPDMVELGNIRASHVIPKSSPRQMVKAFDSYCMAPSPAASKAALRKDDYVQTKDTGNGVETFVVDDRKPAVMLVQSKRKTGCAIVVEARTGQTNRVLDYVNATFPKARALAPSSIGKKTEHAWIAQDGTGAVLFTQRSESLVGAPTYLFGVSRPGS